MLRGSHRQGICCGLSVACALLLTCSSFRSDSESELMEREAVEFISSMPPDLQLHQEHAIRKAIEGDNSALEAVRASRNLEYRLPKNVDTINVDKRYRIYIPAHKPDRPLPLLIYLLCRTCCRIRYSCYGGRISPCPGTRISGIYRQLHRCCHICIRQCGTL